MFLLFIQLQKVVVYFVVLELNFCRVYHEYI